MRAEAFLLYQQEGNSTELRHIECWVWTPEEGASLSLECTNFRWHSSLLHLALAFC